MRGGRRRRRARRDGGWATPVGWRLSESLPPRRSGTPGARRARRTTSAWALGHQCDEPPLDNHATAAEHRPAAERRSGHGNTDQPANQPRGRREETNQPTSPKPMPAARRASAGQRLPCAAAGLQRNRAAPSGARAETCYPASVSGGKGKWGSRKAKESTNRRIPECGRTRPVRIFLPRTKS